MSNAVAMIFKFRSVLKSGHKVTTYNPETREYLIGTAKGEYEYASDRKYHHIRSVDWSGSVERDSLKATSRNSLGSTLALFRLNDETADDLINAQHGKTAEPVDVTEEKEELEQLKEDTISRAHELIKDKILKLDDEELEQLATDDAYLKAEKLSSRDVKAVIPISGVYLVVPPLFSSTFGKDVATYKDASPLEHVRGNHPPFLILYGDRDFPTCDVFSERMCQALTDAKCEASTVKVKDRDHISIIKRMLNDGDPAARAIVEFIGKHSDLTSVPSGPK